MNFFYKRETLTKSITLMAMMAAINIVLSLLGAFVPLVSVFLVIILPLTSSIIEYCCKDKYFPIYALGTIGLSIAATFYNLEFTIFYIVPSIITGYIFGLMVKKNVAPVWSILTATIVQTGISFALVPLVELITQRNIVEDIKTLFNLNENADNFIILIFYFVSLVQTILSFIVVHNEMRKFNFNCKKITDVSNWVSLAGFVVIGLDILFFFIYKKLAYVCLLTDVYFCFFTIANFIENKQYNKIIATACVVFVNIFIFAIFNPLITNGSQFLLFLITPAFIELIHILKLKFN